MRRILLLLISLYVLLPSGYSKPRPYSQTLDIANVFYHQLPGSIAVRSLSASNLKLAYSAYKDDILTRSTENAYFYVFNIGDNNGFILVSGDDSAKEILGYSMSGNFSIDSIPTNFRNWLDVYKKEINLLMNSSTTSSATTLKTETSNISATAISPLLGNIKWDQSSPYNILCPKSGLSLRSTYTGCVATAIAQIMKYYQYPVKGISSKTYLSKTINKQLTVDFSATNYDWSNMLDTYIGTESDAQKNAVATLMYHCGVAANMDYSTTGSSAYDEAAAMGLINYFGYDPNLRTIYRDYYSADEWELILRSELNNSRPVLYGGGNKNNEGHAFVCDGYDTNNLYHFNWGWNGSCDGYYALTSLNPNSSGTDAGSTDGGYTIAQDMTIGIQKPSTESKPSYQLLLNDESDMTFTTQNTSGSSTFSMSVPFYNGGITSFNGKTAIGLYKDSNLIATLGATGSTILSGFNDGSYYGTTFSYTNISLPANLSNGTYQLYSVYKGNDETSWSKMRGLATRVAFFSIQLVDGTATLKDGSATGIDNIINNQLRIYPGITKDLIYVQSDDIVKTISIVDLSGKQILLIKPETNGEISISVSNLIAGTYILRCEISSGFKAFKFIKCK